MKQMVATLFQKMYCYSQWSMNPEKRLIMMNPSRVLDGVVVLQIITVLIKLSVLPNQNEDAFFTMLKGDTFNSIK